MLSYTSQADWAGWVAQLSGASPIMLDGVSTTISTRYSYALFNGQANARAYDFVLSQVQMWYPASQIEEHEFLFDGQTWKNLMLTLPGSQKAQEVILLTAHLDSTAPEAHKLAPGAEDNASGSAALLEAARLWRSFPLPTHAALDLVHRRRARLGWQPRLCQRSRCLRRQGGHQPGYVWLRRRQRPLL